MNSKHLLPIWLATAMILTACHSRPHNADNVAEGDTLQFHHAKLLTLTTAGETTWVSIRDPWDSTRTLHRYQLVPKTAATAVPQDGYTLVRTPLERVGVYSSVHCALLEELGCAGVVAGVCEPEYINLPYVQEGVKNGRIANLGNGMDPNLERIMDLKPDALMPSPFEHSGGYGRLERLGIPLIECADYMEPSPLGRAEWMRFYGRLVGQGQRADSMFHAIAGRYNQICMLAANTEQKPLIVSELPQNGKWYVAGGRSTMGRMYEDAGGRYAFADVPSAGSITLSVEHVIEKAARAQVWIVKHHGPIDRAQLEADNPSLRLMKAQMWFCDTSRKRYYEETPFHPDWLLENLTAIFHPELGIKAKRRYFQPEPPLLEEEK